MGAKYPSAEHWIATSHSSDRKPAATIASCSIRDPVAMSACDNRALQYVTLSSNHGHSRSLVRRKRSRRRSASVLRTDCTLLSPWNARR